MRSLNQACSFIFCFCAFCAFLWLVLFVLLCRSIVVSFYKPVLSFEVAVDAIKRLLSGALERHIPLVSSPAIVAPPITISSPRTSQLHDFSINTALLTLGADLRGPTLVRLHYRSQRWTKHSKTETRLITDCQLPIGVFTALTKLGFGGQSEVLQAKRMGPVSIEQHWRA